MSAESIARRLIGLGWGEDWIYLPHHERGTLRSCLDDAISLDNPVKGRTIADREPAGHCNMECVTCDAVEEISGNIIEDLQQSLTTANARIAELEGDIVSLNAAFKATESGAYVMEHEYKEKIAKLEAFVEAAPEWEWHQLDGDYSCRHCRRLKNQGHAPDCISKAVREGE